MQLESFDHFCEIALGCRDVFFRLIDISDGKELTAYAGRVYWKGTFEPDEEQPLKEHLRQLTDLRAKRVLKTMDVDLVFR
jgi:hypothetical protein